METPEVPIQRDDPGGYDATGEEGVKSNWKKPATTTRRRRCIWQAVPSRS